MYVLKYSASCSPLGNISPLTQFGSWTCWKWVWKSGLLLDDSDWVSMSLLEWNRHWWWLVTLSLCLRSNECCRRRERRQGALLRAFHRAVNWPGVSAVDSTVLQHSSRRLPRPRPITTVGAVWSTRRRRPQRPAVSTAAWRAVFLRDVWDQRGDRRGADRQRDDCNSLWSDHLTPGENCLMLRWELTPVLINVVHTLLLQVRTVSCHVTVRNVSFSGENWLILSPLTPTEAIWVQR